jgi:hypothetical protein
MRVAVTDSPTLSARPSAYGHRKHDARRLGLCLEERDGEFGPTWQAWGHGCAAHQRLRPNSAQGSADQLPGSLVRPTAHPRACPSCSATRPASQLSSGHVTVRGQAT